MAATVMLVEQKVIPPELAGPIAPGVAHAIDQATKPGFVRPTDVLAALRTDPQRLLDELESDWTPRWRWPKRCSMNTWFNRAFAARLPRC